MEITEHLEEDKEPRARKDTSYKQVFLLFGKYPRNWDMNRTQIQAAKNLLEELGIEDVTKVLKWYNNHKEDPYCPVITSPYDLDSKFLKLKEYKNRLYD